MATHLYCQTIDELTEWTVTRHNNGTPILVCTNDDDTRVRGRRTIDSYDLMFMGIKTHTTQVWNRAQ
jgi:hypothetical protein